MAVDEDEVEKEEEEEEVDGGAGVDEADELLALHPVTSDTLLSLESDEGEAAVELSLLSELDVGDGDAIVPLPPCEDVAGDDVLLETEDEERVANDEKPAAD